MWVDVDYRKARSLKPAGADQVDGLELRVDDVLVKDPWEVRLYVWSAGENDIRREAFQNEEQLIDLSAPIVQQTVGAESDARKVVTVLDAAGSLRILPQYIPKRFAREYLLITEGRPLLSWENVIADCEVRSFYRDWATPSPGKRAVKVIGRVCGVLALLTVVAMFVTGAVVRWPVVETDDPIFSAVPGSWEPYAFIGAATILFWIAIALTTLTDLASRRAQRAVRVLRGAVGSQAMDLARTV